MGKTAIVDIDNTLWPFSDAFHRELKKTNAGFPPPDQWSAFDFWKGHCSDEEFIAAINAVHHHQDSDLHRPYPESRGFLSSLKENGFHLIVASHRVEATRGPTERWLARHRLPCDELHLSWDKTVLFSQADVVVDDSPQTLEKAVRSGSLAAGLLFAWNRAYVGRGFGLFDNLDEVLEHILRVCSAQGPGRTTRAGREGNRVREPLAPEG